MKKLIKLETELFKIVPINHFLDLSEDTFLTGYLDGSDKIYGFCNFNGKIMIKSRDGYQPITKLTKDDLTYIFNCSKIFTNLKYYEINKLDDFEIKNLELWN